MLSAIVDVHRYPAIVQHIGICLLEIAGMHEHMSGDVRDIDSPNSWMKRGGVRRVADAEADDQRALWVVQREKWNVSQGAHIALAEWLRSRHWMPVRHQGSSLVRRFRHRDDLGDALAESKKAPFARRQYLRPSNDVVGWQLQPERNSQTRHDARGESRRRGPRMIG